ncbi:uroporphyrinogen decarboxylase family protein [Breznakiellaceae bacterium SP9]
MTSKERVKAAFAHKEADTVPVDFGNFCCSNINAIVMKRLREHYGLPAAPIKIKDMSTMVGVMEPDLMDVMGCDVQELDPYSDTFGNVNENWKEWTYRGETVLIPGGCALKDDGKGGTYIYPFGDTSVEPSGLLPSGGFYFDNLQRSPEFDEDNANPFDQVEDFPVVSDAMLDFHKKRMAVYTKGTRAIQVSPGYFGFGDANNIPGPNVKHPKGIRDITEWYTAPLLYPDYVNAVFEIETERAIESFKKYFAAFGNALDVVYICGTDFGSQRGPLINPETFRTMYVPHYKKLTDWIHSNTEWKVIKHCCGGIFPIIPYLIEAGIDALNPVQCSAEGMEPQGLKNAYGKDLVFWGGGVNTQQTLPFGTPAEVRAEVLERLRIFSKGGGYVFNSIHNIQANTPVPNIVAMVDAVKEFNGTK